MKNYRVIKPLIKAARYLGKSVEDAEKFCGENGIDKWDYCAINGLILRNYSDQSGRYSEHVKYKDYVIEGKNFKIDNSYVVRSQSDFISLYYEPEIMGMNNKLTTKQMIRGLEMSLSNDAIQEVSTKQIIEKLRMIRTENINTMCFHPDIIEKLREEDEGIDKKKSSLRIWKYKLSLDNCFCDEETSEQYYKLNLRKSAKILCVHSQGTTDVNASNIYLWALIDIKKGLSEGNEERKIYILGTDHELSGHEGDYIGTVVGTRYVWHFFDEKVNSEQQR